MYAYSHLVKMITFGFFDDSKIKKQNNQTIRRDLHVKT